MRREKLGSESGRIWAGMGGVLLMAIGAALVATVAFSTDSPAGRVPAAQANHDTLTEEEIEELPNGTKIVICHTEGNGSQHTIEVASEAFLNAGHFDASGNPLHAVGAVHDFIISVEGIGVINEEGCGAAATPTATQPVATSTQQVVASSTPTSTAVPPTNTPTATVAVATSTQQAEGTSTPTNTPVPTNTAVSTNTPGPTATAPAISQVQGVQVTPTVAPVSRVQGVQATPPPAVRALPAAGNGGYEDNSAALLIGLAMILAGTSISFAAMKRRA